MLVSGGDLCRRQKHRPSRQARPTTLSKTKPSVISVMRMRGTLLPYLQRIDEQANEMFSQLVKQFAKQEGVTEELKCRDQMAWVCAMNNIRNRVNEIILSEVIFV